MKMYSIYIFIILLSFFACKKTDNINDAKLQVPLLQTEWILSYIQNTKTSDLISYPNDSTPLESIVFVDSTNTLYVRGTCNGCQGKYSLLSNNDSIWIGGISCTQVYCKYYLWEDYLMNNLDSIFLYKIINDKLTIYSKGDYNLIFIAKD